MSEQTLGERRVRATFNPTADSTVDHFKGKTAALIDALEDMKNAEQDPELKRLCALAQTAYEEAAMWAVKAATA